MIKYFLFAIVAIMANFLLLRCANIQPPTGGPKDVQPPKVRRTVPSDKTINYKGNTVEIQFDEDISPFGEELLVTPYYSKKVDIHVVHNKVKIQFQQLDTNTTYTINFREQVKDFTEKNALVNYTFTFSTGPYLDSLTVAGQVIDLMTNQPAKGALISLYRFKDSTKISKDKPYYLSETDKTGKFLINNVKAGDYRIYALKDANNTLNFDNPGDLIDFDTIHLSKNIKDLVFKVSKIDTTAPKLIHETNINENTFVIRFSEGIKEFKLLYKDKKSETLLSDDARDLKIYNASKIIPENDSIPISIFAQDSLGNSDTLKFKIVFEKGLKEKKDTKKEEEKNAQIINKVLPSDKSLTPDTSNIKIYLKDAWLHIHTDSLSYMEDSIPVKLTSKDLKENKELGLLEIKRINKAKDSVLLTLKKSLFITINNDTSLQQKLKFKIKKVEDLGTLSGIVDTKEESYILQLLDNKYNAVHSLTNPKTFEFKFLNPGAYYIRILVDKNRNGKWDQASLSTSTKAEPVFFYTEKIDIRGNWDIQDTVIKF